MIKIGWVLISVKTKSKLMIGNLKNTENVTSHHLHRKKKVSPLTSVWLDMRVTIRFSFHTPHLGPHFF